MCRYSNNLLAFALENILVGIFSTNPHCVASTTLLGICGKKLNIKFKGWNKPWI